jgi:cytochrome c553
MGKIPINFTLSQKVSTTASSVSDGRNTSGKPEMFMTNVSLIRAIQAVLAAVGLIVMSAAQAVTPAPTTWPAGDAWNGKSVYLLPTPAYAAYKSCGDSSCHGPSGTNAGDKNYGKVAGGANNPTKINNAIRNGTMTNAWLLAMTAQQIADVAAFLGNPGVTGPSAAPVAALSTTSLSFGSTTVGGVSAAQSVTLSNSGTAALSLASIASSNAAFRVAGGTCAAGGTVGPGASCTVSMTFNPTASGAANGTLTLTHNASPTTSTVALSGSGAAAAAPIAAVAPASLSFASTAVGTTSAAQSVTLTNSGAATLTLGTIATDSAAFIVSGGSCAPGASLAVGASCSVSLSFRPAASGAASGALTISHNASPNTSTVALTGTGAAAVPIASLTPTSLSFSQVLASTSSNQTVTLSNTGSAVLSIGTITIAGAQASEFAKSGTCANGASIAVGGNCTVLVNFTPVATGARAANLTITHNAAGSPSAVTLNGTGTSTPQPVIAVNNNALSFASQALASTSATQTVTVSNAGQAALVLASVSLSGANGGDFALSGTCAANASIAAGASCALTVRFTPTALGGRAASVSIASNASPVTISLSGTGVATPAPAVTLAPGSLDFGLSTVGAAPIARTVSLTNGGTAALSLSAVNVTGNGFGGSHNCGTSVASGASCTLTLTFSPPSAAATTGQVSVVSNASGSPHTVALAGTGVLASTAVLNWSGAASATFADTAIGSVSAPTTLTLSNQGPGTASINSISIAGADAAEFLSGGSCAVGASLAANATCTVSVAMAPAQVGPRAATLNVGTNGNGPPAAALSGNGVMSAQQLLAVSATAINFPPLTQSAAVSTLPVTVTNTGTAPLRVTALMLNSSAFSATPASGSLPSTLAPAQSLDVNVSLNAANAAPGDLTDTLTVMTDTAGLSRTLEVRASVSADAAPTPVHSNVGAGGALGQPGAVADWLLGALCSLSIVFLWRRRKAS